MRSCWVHGGEREGGAGEVLRRHGIARSLRPPDAAAARRPAILRGASRSGLPYSSRVPEARAPLRFLSLPLLAWLVFTSYFYPVRCRLKGLLVLFDSVRFCVDFVFSLHHTVCLLF